MSQISLIPKYEEKCGFCNGEAVSKIYLMEGQEISRIISPYSVAPLRILTYIMEKNGIDFKTEINGNDPWQITRILLDDKYANYVKVALQEIMEYRCSYELGNQYEEIIRQLPFEVAMRTSQNIMDFGKSQEEHNNDLWISSKKWLEYNMMLGSFSSENPNDTKDNITISNNNPVLRKHLIYKSTRGGYNIKTKGYSDSSLDHYCFIDSSKWD